MKGCVTRTICKHDAKQFFIGVGAQKCASSWLYSVLEDHPEVGMAKVKEVDFFSYFYDRGIEWYEKFYRQANLKTYGEISPSYLHHQDAPRRLFEYDSNAKIIVALRNPIERAYSNHLHEVRLGHFTGPDISFESGLKNNLMYLEQSLYHKHLANWFSVFPKKQIHVVFQENIRIDPAAHARDLYRFLDIESSFQSDKLYEKNNESYIPKNKRFESAWQFAANWARKNHLSFIVNKLRNMELIDQYINSSRLNARDLIPPMRPETRANLVQYFAADVQGLMRMLGRSDLPWKDFNSLFGASSD